SRMNGPAAASTSTRSRPATSAPTTRGRWPRIRCGTGRFSTGFPPVAGASPTISVARSYFCPRRRPPTYTVPSCRSTAAGWDGSDRAGGAGRSGESGGTLNTRASIVAEVERLGVVAVIRLKDAARLRAVVDALALGGVRALEVTMTVPNAVTLI